MASNGDVVSGDRVSGVASGDAVMGDRVSGVASGVVSGDGVLERGSMLAGIRVVDFSVGVTGPYVTKLLADAGADVIKVEDADGGGDPVRRWSATRAEFEGDSALFSLLNASKRGIVGRPGDPEIEELVAGADAVVESFPAGSGVGAAWAERHPHLVVLSVTPFGQSGPLASQPSTEYTVQAETGAIACRGRPDQPPIHAGGGIADWTAGAYGGPAVLSALLRAGRTGRGEHIDLAVADVIAIAATTFSDLAHSMRGGGHEFDRVARSVEAPSIEPALDGWVGFNTNTALQYQGFVLMIERPDLMDTEWSQIGERAGRLDEWNAMVHPWTSRHTVAEIIKAASELRVPVAEVNDGRSVLDNEQFVARGVFVRNPGGFLQPRPPYLMDDGGERGAATPAPRLGEHTGTVEARTRPVVSGGGAASSSGGGGGVGAGAAAGASSSGGGGGPEGDPERPLAGIRVVDLTSWWAGPSATGTLAMLGADVIHVESTGHPDGMRMTGFMFGAEDWWEWGSMFVAVNANKRGLTLDLDTDAGRDLLWRLIDGADAVVENFSPRVVEKWGLSWEAVSARNPRAVFMRMPAFGLSGPWRERVGFAQTMEQLTGMAWVTGHVDDQPRIMRGPCDPIAGMHGAYALIVGLAVRERTGRGVFVESTMVEAALNCSAEQIVEYTAYGNVMERAGNRGPYAAPQGLYPCRGHEQWLALAVASDAQWEALVGVLGRPGWADRAEYATDAGRRAGHDAIDEGLAAWAAGQDVGEAVAVLVAAGVPAAPARDPRLQHEHPQLAHRGLFETVEHPAVGTHPMPGMPYRFASLDRWITSPSPTLGQHNGEILAELGLSPADIATLEANEVIGTRPNGL
ncbi:CaiB/BaiF CoA transferase family protein [Candidatus Poriferisocius sp.]|uniref:CaiB/BaiF CoA transferase family protein n=1 Tax=Candidatus Poriferisocius sp. TaxID=3101276 RepID=UPI003B5C8DE0